MNLSTRFGITALLSLGACLCVSAQNRVNTAQHADNCSVNVSGSNNTVTITCKKLDEGIVRQITEILNLARDDSAKFKRISDKLDEIKQQLITADKVTAVVNQQGIANVAPNFGTQTVNNFAPPGRQIPADVRDQCRDFLAKTHLKVSVQALMGDAEGFKYAQEWYDLFSTSGWEMTDPHVMAIIQVGAPTQGLVVSFHGSDTQAPAGQSVSVPPLLIPLAECFQKASIRAIGVTHSDMPEDSVRLLIGSNSN